MALLLGSLILFKEQSISHPGPPSELVGHIARDLDACHHVWIHCPPGGQSTSEKPTTGEQGMVGEIGTAATEIDGTGKVFVHGEYWDVRSQIQDRRRGSRSG